MKLQRNEKKLNELYGWDEIRNIADAIIDRAESNIKDYTEDAYEAIVDALNDELIYTADQWEVMRAYQSPDNANFSEAVNEFINDLMDCVEVVNDDE